MKRLFKIVGIVVGVLVAVLVAAALLIPLFFNPNDYKDQIAAIIEKQIGRDVTIEGDLALSVFPWLGVKTGPVQVANAQGFGKEPFARITGADVRIKLLPLLRREVEMDTVRLDGLVLNLARNEKGKTNWEDLLEAKTETGAPTAPPADKRTEEGKPDGQALGALALGGIQITDAKVDWNDRQAGTRYTLTQADLRSGQIELGKPFTLSAEFDFQAPKQALNGHMALSGEVDIDPNAARYQFNDAKVTVLVKGEGLPPEGVEGRLTTGIAADLKQQTLTVPQLALTAAGINVSGSLQGSRILDAPAFQGALHVAEFNPREVLKRLGQTLPVTADPQVLSRAQADLELAASPQHLKIGKLAVKLDASTLNGSAEVRDFAKPRIAFDLALDSIDADRYLPPPDETAPEPKAATPAGAAAGAAGELPLDMLRSLNLNGTLRIGQMKVYGLRTSDIRLVVAAKDGVTRVQPATANLYQGKYEGNMSLDVRGKTPQLSVNDKLIGVQAGPLLKDLSGNDRITGTADLTARLGMTGLTMDAIRSSLNGNASFAFRDGAVKGVNIAALIRDVRTKLKGEQAPSEQAVNQTDFSELTGTLNIADGVVHNRDLSGKSPLLRVTGEGSVNLKTEQIDYLLKTVLVKTLKGQGGKGLEELAGVTIPVRIAGSMTDPSFRPDLEAAVGEKVRTKVEEKVEEKREELKKGLEDKLQERLQKLLPR